MSADTESDAQDIHRHHFPQTQGLELLTAPEAADGWALFFAKALELGERVKQRRATRTTGRPDTEMQQGAPDLPCDSQEVHP